jgi:hypothetical protein
MMSSDENLDKDGIEEPDKIFDDIDHALDELHEDASEL